MTEAPAMPPPIAAGIVNVMSKVKQLGADGRNDHGRYNFVSVDKFYSAIGPLCAAAGIFVLANETSSETYEAKNSKGDTVNMLRIVYAMNIVHETGAMYGPVERSVTVVAAGPQAYASALSFVTKYFMRNLFQIPTGEKDDADLAEPENTPVPPKNTAGGSAASTFARSIQKMILEGATAATMYAFESQPENRRKLARLRVDYASDPEISGILERLDALYTGNKSS